MVVLLALPLLGLIESRVDRSPLLEVRSEIVIEASDGGSGSGYSLSRDRDATDWYLGDRGGLSDAGENRRGRSGAIRYCEFSTGVFVEPITVRWEESSRLSFDVSS